MPVLCGREGNVCLAWVNNSGNDWLGRDGRSSILYSRLTEEGWSAPTVAYEDLGPINSIAADQGEEWKVAYCMDTDGDITTSGDMRVYENGSPVSSGEAASV